MALAGHRLGRIARDGMGIHDAADGIDEVVGLTGFSKQLADVKAIQLHAEFLVAFRR